MMKSIVNEKLVSFKEIEKKVFAYVCELGCEILRMMLERYDTELSEERDKTCFRNKGLRSTCIKTLCGEVEYRRRVYETKTNGEKRFVYLLDEAMKRETIGLISANLAERIVMLVTETPYRVAAETISSTSGQSISPQGVWDLVQKLGERINEEETHAVRRMESGQSQGKKALPILFEEMDGVWLRMQDRHHKKAAKQEMKVSTTYEGWEGQSTAQSRLVGKTMLAGMEKSVEFHEKREAQLRDQYDADEIGQRVLNGDGGSWIRDPYDAATVFQLDRFHIHKAIREKIQDTKAQREIVELFRQNRMEEMLDYIQIYGDSVAGGEEGDKRSKKAGELYQYLWNNRSGLLPYQEQLRELPKAEEGIEYRQMGVQENQNCTVITLRMKNRRMRWSERGANNMAKALYRKENRELIETIDRYTDGLLFEAEMQEVTEVWSAAKAPKRDGKGNVYADIVGMHVPLLDAMQTASRKAFRRAFL